MSKQKTKGLGFERNVQYSLIEGGYKAIRTGDNNIAGVDVVATLNGIPYYIECKNHKAFSWNQLVKYYIKTEKFAKKTDYSAVPILVFKANQQPVLVMTLGHIKGYKVIEFDTYFGCEYQIRPKGHKFLKEVNDG